MKHTLLCKCTNSLTQEPCSLTLVFKAPTELDVINIQFSEEEDEAWWDCDFIGSQNWWSHRDRIQT